MKARIAARVNPHAKKTALAVLEEGGYRLWVREPPTDGRANEACVRFLAVSLGVPRSRVTLVSGHGSRMKVFEIADLEPGEVQRRLSEAAKGEKT